MKDPKKIILLKLTGQVLTRSNNAQSFIPDEVITIAKQIKQLSPTHQFGIVIGGGNIFRGSQQGPLLGLRPSVAHHVGMLATVMNALMMHDIFTQQNLSSALFCTIPAPELGNAICQQTIENALTEYDCLIFSGGTGNPFFSTDTAAILRGLQMGASEVWKATNVDGIYAEDPHQNPKASLLKQISYNEMLQKKLGIMDLAAIALAQQYQIPIRVFNIFSGQSLLKTATDDTVGSLVR